jgi:hypothetical protein
MAVEIGRAVGFAPKLGVLGPALAEARASTRFSEGQLVAYAFDLLRRNGRKVRDPSSFLATDLRRLDDNVLPSPRMTYAGLIDQLEDLDDRLHADAGVLIRFESRLGEGMALGNDDGYPAPWEVEGAALEVASRIAREVVDEFRPSLDREDPA